MKLKFYLRSLALASIAICFQQHSAQAQFSGEYDPANWSTVQINGANGSVNPTNAPTSIILTGPDNVSGNAYTRYEILVPATGTISFNWSVAHNDPTYDGFGYWYNNTYSELTNVTASGTTSINVTGGQTFAFYGHTYDGCCGTFNATISNFVGPQAVSDDAGIAAILSPSLPTCDLDSIDIEVVLENLGSDTLQNCSIHYQVNTNPVVSTYYTGNVAPSGGTDTVLLGNVSFSNGDDLVIWTTLPNGTPDSLTSNDTAALTLSTGLLGTYSIPGDFSDLGEAATALNIFGVCGDVVMELATGTYDEQVLLGEILGTGANATVTFTSATGNANNVKIRYTSTGSTDNHVVYLNGSDWVRFTDVTIRNYGTSLYATAVRLENGAENNWFDGCTIMAGPYSYTGSQLSAVYSYGMNHNLTLTNNTILRGGYGLYIYGSSSTVRVENVVVENNVLKNAYYYQNYLYYVDGLEFHNNVVTNDSNLYPYGPRGLWCYYVDNFNITGNYIGSDVTSGSYGGYGYPFYMYYCIGSNNPRSMIANNCINAGAVGTTSYGYYGFYSSSSGIYNFHNNSVTRRGGNNGNYASYFTSGGLVSVKNNSFADYYNGYAMYAPGGFTIAESENNNFYTTGGTLVYHGSNGYSSLEAYQNASGYDLQSINTDPAWEDTLACITCNDTLDNAGTNTSVAMYDIDSNMRSATTPDIGAIEWISPVNFTLGGDSTYCADEVTIEAGPAQNVTWSVNGNSSSAPTLTLTAGTEATIFNILVSIQTQYCGSGSDNALITLVPNANLDSAEHICAGESTVLNPGGAASGTYSWSNGAATQTITVSKPGTYAVTKNELGCASTASTVITQSDAVQILGTEVCDDDMPLQLDATIADGISYAWSGGASPTTAVNTFNDGGLYSVTATDAFGCSSVDSFVVSVLGEPQAVITIPSYSELIYIFDASTSSYLTSTSTVNWNFGAGATPVTSNNVTETVVYPWTNPSSPASYSVSLEINNGCGVDIDTKVIQPSVGIEDLKAGEFLLFPNPASDVVTIATKEVDAGNILVLDMSGRTVARMSIEAGTNNHELNIGNLAAGSYIVKVVNGKSTQMQQLIIR